MAVCTFCELEMTSARSCVIDGIIIDGERFALAPYRGPSGRRVAGSADRCGDCGVARGGLHHPGCDLQRCPRCRDQLISCACVHGPDDLDLDDLVLDDRLLRPIDLNLPSGTAWLGAPLEPFGIDSNGNPMSLIAEAGSLLFVHHADVPESDLTTVDGIRCTTALRTVIDLASAMPAEHVRENVDDAIARGLFTAAELERRLAEPDMVAYPGAVAVRSALSWPA